MICLGYIFPLYQAFLKVSILFSKSTDFSMTCLSGSQRNHTFSEHNIKEDWYYQPKGVALK